jgi:hypothetical protein
MNQIGQLKKAIFGGRLCFLLGVFSNKKRNFSADYSAMFLVSRVVIYNGVIGVVCAIITTCLRMYAVHTVHLSMACR